MLNIDESKGDLTKRLALEESEVLRNEFKHHLEKFKLEATRKGMSNVMIENFVVSTLTEEIDFIDSDGDGNDDEVDNDFEKVDVPEDYDEDDYEAEYGTKIDNAEPEDIDDDDDELTESNISFFKELQEELNITDEELTESLEIFNEGKAYTKKTKIIIDPRQKFNRLVGALTVAIAKEKNDKLYLKLIKFKKLWIAMKGKLRKKYLTKAIARAKEVNKKET